MRATVNLFGGSSMRALLTGFVLEVEAKESTLECTIVQAAGRKFLEFRNFVVWIQRSTQTTRSLRCAQM